MPDESVTREAAADLSLGLIRMVKLMHALKQHAPRVHPAVDTMAYPLLFNLAQEPMRVSALADCIHSDVSTVSRQVSGLVGHGLLEKVSDPLDGRAQVVTLSAEGHALIATIQQERVAWFRELLADWSAEDTETFATYVTRFGDTLQGLHERLANRPEPTTTEPTTTEPTTTEPTTTEPTTTEPTTTEPTTTEPTTTEPTTTEPTTTVPTTTVPTTTDATTNTTTDTSTSTSTSTTTDTRHPRTGGQ